MATAEEKISQTVPEFLTGGGELGELMREFDWTATPLGAVESWPQSLRTCVRIMLTSRQPIWIGWGKELIKLYNDPYKAIVGGKHPWALGKPASVVWKDIWRDIEPMLKQVMEKDEGTYVESQLLIMERNGYPEETYYTFSYTPIPGDNGGTAGMICANTDDTERIISERQLTTITQLAKNLADSRTDNEIIENIISTLSENPYDFPFSSFYLVKEQKAILAKSSVVSPFPDEVDIYGADLFSQLLRLTAETKKMQLYEKPNGNDMEFPKGGWPISSGKAIIVPIFQAGGKDLFGFLITGLNPYRLLDEKYESFFTLVADQITSTVSDIHALEEERKRARALAEIDRAKTIFFSNISHEFRTPLTLLLGPIADAVNDPLTRPENKTRMEVAYRNALRMQRLVNTLLEFSRIEAGRMEAKFAKVDICTFTQDLASTFRSAIEEAGMHLEFECYKIDGDVYVDVDMWEKIVLNLVSNAFKYSKTGTIKISVSQAEDKLSLLVSDNGTGIPEDHLDKIFDRFHRVENTHGRSQEGTGIGLAMVKELVKMHHGTITVQSKVNQGSTFTVTVPIGKDHLQEENIVTEAYASVSKVADAFVQEAMKWLPGGIETPVESEADDNEQRPLILLADDNTDMRDYVQRLLKEQFRVVTAVNGKEAFEKMLLLTPDLLLTDVMMPVLDGFGLINKVRSHSELKNTPVIFLSARAGEEAKLEGLKAGADDYLVKPFSAKELLAKVGSTIEINRIRRQTEQQFYQMFLQAPAIINVFKGPDFRYEFFHPKNKEIMGDVDFTGMTLKEALPELEGQGVFELLSEVYNEGKTIAQRERLVKFTNAEGVLTDRYLNFIYQPWYDVNGNIQGVLNFALDITDAVLNRKRIEESEKRFRNLVEQAPVGIAIIRGADYIVEMANEAYLQIVDRNEIDFVGKPLFEVLQEVKGVVEPLLNDVFYNGEPYYGFEFPVILKRHGKREHAYFNFVYQPLRDDNGSITGVVVVANEVTESVNAKHKLQESEAQFRNMVEHSPIGTTIFRGPDHIIEMGNQELFEKIWRRSADEVIGKGALDVFPELRKQKYPELLKRVLTTGETHREKESMAEVKGSDGTQIFYLDFEYAPLREADGSISGVMITVYDVTEKVEARRRLEEVVTELMFFKAELEQKVQERTAALSETNSELERSNEDLQQFAHVASHDLKEPVRKIKIYSNMLQDEYQNTLGERGNNFLDKIIHSTDRIYSMIDGVLKYSTAIAVEIPFTVVDLNEIIENVKVDLELLMKEKSAVIKYDPLPKIAGIPELLYQLFYNLINNSLKFAKDNEPAVITITNQFTELQDGRFVKITLRDNGIGFDNDYAERIFSTFTRLNSKDKYEGTGLGLALCKKIVNRHEGYISAIGHKNFGAEFVIFLPVND